MERTVQVERPSVGVKRPGMQSVQRDRPCEGPIVPAGHSEHCTAPAAENWPAEQSPQPVLAVEAVKRPALQELRTRRKGHKGTDQRGTGTSKTCRKQTGGKVNSTHTGRQQGQAKAGNRSGEHEGKA